MTVKLAAGTAGFSGPARDLHVIRGRLGMNSRLGTTQLLPAYTIGAVGLSG